MNRLQQRDSCLDRADARPANPRIDVDDDLERTLANGSCDRGYVRRIVRSHHQIGDAIVEGDQTLDARSGHDRRSDQERFDAAGREHFGLAELRAAQADRTGIELHARDRETLVSLGVRS